MTKSIESLHEVEAIFKEIGYSIQYKSVRKGTDKITLEEINKEIKVLSLTLFIKEVFYE